MATSHLMTGKHIPHFGLNSLISTLSFSENFCSSSSLSSSFLLFYTVFRKVNKHTLQEMQKSKK